MDGDRTPPRFAARCRYVKMTMGSVAGSGLVNICQHLIREGRQCVGPFLDDAETTCGLWEPVPGASTLPARERH